MFSLWSEMRRRRRRTGVAPENMVLGGTFMGDWRETGAGRYHISQEVM